MTLDRSTFIDRPLVRTALRASVALPASVARIGACAVALSLLSAAPSALGAEGTLPKSAQVDRTDPLPKRLQNIGVDENLGSTIPKSLVFRDTEDRPISLGEMFDGKHPVLVTMNYSDCPMLCSLILNGLVNGLKELDWTLGNEYRVVTVSLNPAETAARAKQTQTRYLSEYGRANTRDGWTFLHSSEANVKALASALGIRYAYNEARNEYVHPSVITAFTPDGKLARYLYGIEFPKQTLKLSLVEAGEGKTGSTLDRLLLYCFHYDSTEGAYAPAALNIMRLSGGLAAILLGGFLAVLWHAELKKKRFAQAPKDPALMSLS